MNESITIPLEEYERLMEAKEQLEERLAVEAWQANPQRGLPDELVARVLDGEAPLRVLREWRGLGQSALARASGVNRVQIADIEAGRKTGSVATLKKLADALGVPLDDLV